MEFVFHTLIVIAEKGDSDLPGKSTEKERFLKKIMRRGRVRLKFSIVAI